MTRAAKGAVSGAARNGPHAGACRGGARPGSRRLPRALLERAVVSGATGPRHTFLIIKNQRYEALLEFGRHFGPQRTIGTSLPNIDFCALARGQGVKAISVNRRDA